MRIKSLKNLALSFALYLIIASCSQKSTGFTQLYNLPPDTGGTQTPIHLGSGKATLGYYVYLPSSYENQKHHYPLLIFLHGIGEIGNSQINPTDLGKVLKNGPPKLIKNKQWNPKYPLVVVSPQSTEWWKPDELHEFIKYISKEYRINTNRIYLTGLSMGGFGTFSYIENYKNSLVAAAIPICGGGDTLKANSFRNIPIWAFHGSADSVVPVENSISMIRAINATDSIADLAKLTIYPSVGHDSWSKTYDLTGQGTELDGYTPFDQSIYDWLFQYEK